MTFKLSPDLASTSLIALALLVLINPWASSFSLATESPIDLPPPPPSIELFSLEDLITAGIKEKSLKDEWASYQTRLEVAFEETNNFEASSNNPELSRIAWERFIDAFSADNPYSDQDNLLRLKAKTQLRDTANITNLPLTQSSTNFFSDTASQKKITKPRGPSSKETTLEAVTAEESNYSDKKIETTQEEAELTYRFRLNTEEGLQIHAGQSRFIYFSNKENLNKRFISNLQKSRLSESYPSIINNLVETLNENTSLTHQIGVLRDLLNSESLTPDTALELNSVKLLAEFVTTRNQKKFNLEQYDWSAFESPRAGAFALSTRTLIESSRDKKAWKKKFSVGVASKKPSESAQKILNQLQAYQLYSKAETSFDNLDVITDLTRQAILYNGWAEIGDYLQLDLIKEVLSPSSTIPNRANWITSISTYFNERGLSIPPRHSVFASQMYQQSQVYLLQFLDYLKTQKGSEPTEVIEIITALGNIHQAWSNFEEAISAKEAILKIQNSHGTRSEILSTKLELADLWILANEPFEAGKYYGEIWDESHASRVYYEPKQIYPLTISTPYLSRKRVEKEDRHLSATLLVHINTYGRPGKIETIESSVPVSTLRWFRSAVEEVFIFRPALKNGKITEGTITLTQSFQVRPT